MSAHAIACLLLYLSICLIWLTLNIWGGAGFCCSLSSCWIFLASPELCCRPLLSECAAGCLTVLPDAVVLLRPCLTGAPPVVLIVVASIGCLTKTGLLVWFVHLQLISLLALVKRCFSFSWPLIHHQLTQTSASVTFNRQPGAQFDRKTLALLWEEGRGSTSRHLTDTQQHHDG